jgi:hypothetical protein
MADAIDDVVQAYTKWFGAPSRVVRGSIATSPPSSLALVGYFPSENEKGDPEADLTLLGTAGLKTLPIARAFSTELALEVAGTPADAEFDALGEALIDVATAPLKTGRRFSKGDLLTNLQLPLFSAFRAALLVDWGLADPFLFPGLDPPVSLLRLVPLLESELQHLRKVGDRSDEYLGWTLRGLAPEDPRRRPFA